MENVIIFTRMYVGSYLQNHIGHEIINLFRDDNGDNYIYINQSGDINPKYNNRVRAVLLVRYVENGVMEVVAKAENLEQVLFKSGDIQKDIDAQISYIDDNKITYGGVPLHRIHGDLREEKISITFKANTLRKVKKPIYLIENAEKMNSYDCYRFLPEKHFSKQSLKIYYHIDKQHEEYKILNDMLSDDSIWESDNTTERLDINDYSLQGEKFNFLSIIKKEYDELVYSNLLAYFFEQNRSVFTEFAEKILGVPSLKKSYNVHREEKNIDILIEDENTIIVIENKIKSKINGEHHDINGSKIQSQLCKYVEYVTNEYSTKKPYFFIFSPDYNRIDLEKYQTGKHYKIIKYSQIYEFFMTNARDMLHMKYFGEFVDALYIHTKAIDNSNFEIMKSRLIERMKSIRAVEFTAKESK